jgi:hypothetical protein
MKQIKDNAGFGEFFLTALIYGSHMSMATASIDSRCLADSWLKKWHNVLALRFLAI